MTGEAAILGREDGGLERRRDLGERGPREPSSRRVHPQLVEHLAVAVEQRQVGGPIRGADDLEGREPRQRASEGEPGENAGDAEGERER